MIGIEPTTYGLQNRCSTVELHRHHTNDIKNMLHCQVFFKNFLLASNLQNDLPLFSSVAGFLAGIFQLQNRTLDEIYSLKYFL